jgi:hypothetical protein
MLNMECQVAFSVLIYLYYLRHFWLTGKGRPLCLKTVHGISVLRFLSAFAKLLKTAICFMNLMFTVPYTLVICIFDCKSDEMHTDCFMYSLLHYNCSTCFECYLHPSSEAQTAVYRRRYVLVLWCFGSWIVNWSRLWLGHPHTYSMVSFGPCCKCEGVPAASCSNGLSNTP